LLKVALIRVCPPSHVKCPNPVSAFTNPCSCFPFLQSFSSLFTFLCLPSSHFSEVSGMTSIWLILSLLILEVIFCVWALQLYKENRHCLQYRPYAKQDEINLSCIETGDDKVIKFLMALTLYGQLFGTPLTVLSSAKIIFAVHYRISYY